jgi:ABC-type transport system involved in cytochrome c biogenesis permease subunit
MPDPSLASTSDTLFWIALMLYAMSLVAFIAATAYRRDGAAALATVLAGIGAAAHAGSIATRGLAAGRVPWGNMFEYSSTITR